jgi:hypothetical protein
MIPGWLAALVLMALIALIVYMALEILKDL